MQGKSTQSIIGALFICAIIHTSQAQLVVHTDHLGAGHNEGIGVTTSSDFTRNGWAHNAIGMRTIDGGGLDAKRMEASRFLSQAAFGGRPDEINLLAENNDFEGWIDWQTTLPRTDMMALTQQVTQQAKNAHIQSGGSANSFIANSRLFQYAWWQAKLTKQDVLRLRVAAAFSEILVISTIGNIRNENVAFASYYDVLLKNAFGNYRAMLKEVTLHPAMGVYLTHFRNPKTNTAENTFPDENYAREILQLFSIGLVQLNNDGTPILDGNGNEIPTYTPEDIRQLAKVFTGLGAGGITTDAANNGNTVSFTITRNNLDYTVPMKMYNYEHESGSKQILGSTIPGGLSGMEDIDAALEIIMNHQNTAPFVSKKLIQQLVKSNPSPAYVSDVADVFNNDDDGVRGNLKSVIKAILLHPEARECLWQTDPTSGKLRNPTQRYLHFAKAMQLLAPNGVYWTTGVSFDFRNNHLPMNSPSVFNFYLPEHQPPGPIRNENLTAPEFQIFNATTSIGYVNEVDTWTRLGNMFSVAELSQNVTLNKPHYHLMASDPEVLVNHLDVVLCHGNLSHETREIVRNALEGLGTSTENLSQRLEIAAFLIMISPEYTILK